jgi:hypothetical protein
MRDDFPTAVKEVLAKRVGQRCSNLECRRVTSGPQIDPDKAVNLGVAAHICAAAAEGPRFDPAMSSQQRSGVENGIWLCQTCAKLVDNDPERYSVATLRAWKAEAEHSTALALERHAQAIAGREDVSARLERLMPELLAEMRADLREHPLSREFVAFKKGLHHWGQGHELVYHPEQHPGFENKIHILINHGLIRNITHNNTPRYLMSEELVAYLGAP